MTDTTNKTPHRSFLSSIAPGILVAATGVGAGDLITAGLAGSRLGVVVAWTAIAGALLKWALNEGVARWQMATGTTLLEGWSDKLGAWIRWVFLAYLLIWSVATGSALMSACGVAGYGLFTPNADADTARFYWGIAHSFIGVALVLLGGYRLFEKLMAVFIGVMFVAVIATAVLIKPDWGAVGTGLIMPTIPRADNALNYILGIIGGVGGTVTLLCYGYWIREEGRTGESGVRACRLDLAIGYGMTAIFGVAMIVIGSKITLTQGGAKMAIVLADQLALTMGTFGRWVFLIGFWGAVFSSLLGVWQSVPYLFADFVYMNRRPRGNVATDEPAIDYTKTKAYRVFLFGLAIVPIFFVTQRVEHIQLTYAVLGALFMPLLAMTLLLMNNRSDWVGVRFRSRWAINVLLVATLVFFAYIGGRKLIKELRPKPPTSAASIGMLESTGRTLETAPGILETDANRPRRTNPVHNRQPTIHQQPAPAARMSIEPESGMRSDNHGRALSLSSG